MKEKNKYIDKIENYLMKYLQKFEKFSLVQEKAELKYSEFLFKYITGVLEFLSDIRGEKEKERAMKQFGFRKKFIGWANDGENEEEKGEWCKNVEFPVSEVIYDTSAIKTGLFIYSLKNNLFNKMGNGLPNYDKGFDKVEVANCREIFSDWLEKKTINSAGQSIIDKVLNSKENIDFVIRHISGANGVFGRPKTIIIDKNITLEDSRKTVRHELQHYTQYINSIMLSYYELFKSGYCDLFCNFEKMSLEKFKETLKKAKIRAGATKFVDEEIQKFISSQTEETWVNFRIKEFEEIFNRLFICFGYIAYATLNKKGLKVGVGKTRTGLEYDFNEKSPKTFFGKITKWFDELANPMGLDKNYLGHDAEYMTHLSDNLDHFTSGNYKKIILDNDVEKAYEIISKKMYSSGFFSSSDYHSKKFNIVKSVRPEAEKDYLKLLKERIKKIKGIK